MERDYIESADGEELVVDVYTCRVCGDVFSYVYPLLLLVQGLEQKHNDLCCKCSERMTCK